MENSEVDKPAWGAGMFALLCILSIGFAIIGIPVGIINVKYKSRMRQARVLIILGVISILIGVAVTAGA